MAGPSEFAYNPEPIDESCYQLEKVINGTNYETMKVVKKVFSKDIIFQLTKLYKTLEWM